MKNKYGFSKYIYYYHKFAATFVTTSILFIILNGLAWVLLLLVKDHSPYEKLLNRNASELKTIYIGKSGEEIEKILEESWTRKFIYEPFTEFKETSFDGQYVNVSDAGFRVIKNQGPWPPRLQDFTIFLFGGSTTFNYGLPDNETIASYLQDELDAAGFSGEVYVYNFGRGFYYSTQEFILFERLLLSGLIPDVAFFIDGLNDFIYFEDEPAFGEVFQKVFSGDLTGTKYLISKLLVKLPLGALIQKHVLPRFTPTSVIPHESMYNDTKVIEKVVNRYRQTIKMIKTVAREYEVQPVFVLQPIPVYKLPPKAREPNIAVLGNVYYAKYGYERLTQVYTQGELGHNVLWLADIQELMAEPLYVDAVHYSAKLSKAIAVHLANYLKTQRYL